MSLLSRTGVCSVLLPLALLILTTGCTGDNYPSMYPVSGVITMDGKPLANAQLGFVPVTDDGEGFSGVGAAESDEQGRFEVYFAEYTGLPEGSYRVTVELPYFDDADDEGGEGSEQVTMMIPSQYETEDTTPLQIQVQAIENNEISLEIKK